MRMSRYDEVMAEILTSFKEMVEGIHIIDGKEYVSPSSVKNTDSPIEELLFIQLKSSIVYGNFDERYNEVLTPQFKIDKGDSYIKVDFLYEVLFLEDDDKSVRLVIECDGHDYHEKTKEQAQKDKSRDRFLLNEGYYVMRFTGSEIYKSPKKCVNEIMEFVTDKTYGDEIRKIYKG